MGKCICIITRCALTLVSSLQVNVPVSVGASKNTIMHLLHVSLLLYTVAQTAL